MLWNRRTYLVANIDARSIGAADARANFWTTSSVADRAGGVLQISDAADDGALAGDG